MLGVLLLCACADGPTPLRLIAVPEPVLQPTQIGDPFGPPCTDVNATTCRGGFAVTAAWARLLRQQVAGTGVSELVVGTDSFSRLPTTHPRGWGVNTLVNERLKASCAVAPMELFYTRMRKEILQAYLRASAKNGRPVVTTNARLESDVFMAYYDLIQRVWTTEVGGRTVGVMWLWSEESRYRISRALAMYMVTEVLRLLHSSITVIVLMQDSPSCRDASCADRLTEASAGLEYDLTGVEVVVLPGGTATTTTSGADVRKVQAAWLVPRRLSDGITALDLLINPPGYEKGINSTPSIMEQDIRGVLPVTTPEHAADTVWLQEQVDGAAAHNPAFGSCTAPMPNGFVAGAGAPLVDACRGAECPLGTFFADAALAATPGADLAVLAGGVFKSGWPQGPVRAESIYSAAAVHAPLCVVAMRATELVRLLELSLAELDSAGAYNSSSACGSPGLCGSFPQLAGTAKLEYNPALPPLRRITSLLLPTATNNTSFSARSSDPQLAPPDRRRTYAVVMTAPQCSGTYGHKPEGEPVGGRTTLHAAAVEYLLAESPVTPALEGRVAVSASSASMDFRPLTAADCGDSGVYVPEWDDCDPCPPHFWNPNGGAQCEAVEETGTVQTTIVVVALSLIFCVLCVAVFWWWRRRVGARQIEQEITDAAKLKNDNEVAEDLAEAIATMRLEEVDYIFDQDRYPSEIQEAFREIVRKLRTFRTYLPPSIFGGGEADDVSSCGASSYGTDQRRKSASTKRERQRTQHRMLNRVKQLQNTRLYDKLGTVMMVEIDAVWHQEGVLSQFADGISVDTATFLKCVLDQVSEWEGVTLNVHATGVLMAWNTHRPRPDHAYAACRCASSIYQMLEPLSVPAGHITWWGAGLATGQLSCGHSGTTDHRCPVAVGPAVPLARNLAQLGRRVNARLLISDGVYDHVAKLVDARVVDCVTEQHRDGTFGGLRASAAFAVSECTAGSADERHSSGNLVRPGPAIWRSRGAARGAALLLSAAAPRSVDRVQIEGTHERDSIKTGLIWCFDGEMPEGDGLAWTSRFNHWDATEFGERCSDPESACGAALFDHFDIPSAGESAVVRLPQGTRILHVVIKVLSTFDDKAGTVSAAAVALFRKEQTLLVYELLEEAPSYAVDSREYVQGFLELQALRLGEARRLLASHLRSNPRDKQGGRLLRVSLLLDEGHQERGYVRPFFGWEDLEGQAASMVCMPDEMVGSLSEATWEASQNARFTAAASSKKDSEQLQTLLGDIGRKYGAPHGKPMQMLQRECEALEDVDVDKRGSLVLTHLQEQQELGRVITSNSAVGAEVTRTWYRSDQMLGAGTFGEVWLGMDGEGGLVAMKAVKLPSSLGGPEDEEAARALIGLVREVRVLADLRHDNVVAYIGSALSGNCVVIVMEFLSGGSLEGLLALFGRLQVGAVQRYVRDVLRGLMFLHSREPIPIVHRDLKPGNVMLTIEGACKLVDFGTAGELSRRIGNRQGMVGTPLYISPEATLTLGGPPCDVWSLGVMMCQILTGRFPYSFSETEFHPFRFMMRLGTDAESMVKVPTAGVPPDAVSFMKACLQVKPTKRPSTDQLLITPFLVATQPDFDAGAVEREGTTPAEEPEPEEELAAAIDDPFAMCDSEED